MTRDLVLKYALNDILSNKGKPMSSGAFAGQLRLLDMDEKEFNDNVTVIEEIAKANDLAIVYGESDDVVNIIGIIHESCGCFHGDKIRINRAGIVHRPSSAFAGEIEDTFFVPLINYMCAEEIKIVWRDERIKADWAYFSNIDRYQVDIRRTADKCVAGEKNIFCGIMVIDKECLPNPITDADAERIIERIKRGEM